MFAFVLVVVLDIVLVLVVVADDGGVAVLLLFLLLVAVAYLSPSALRQATPTDVFDAVNAVVAAWLAAEPIHLPTFEQCLAEHRMKRPPEGEDAFR